MMNKLLILSVLLLTGCGAKYERGQCYKNKLQNVIVQITSVNMGKSVTISYGGIEVDDDDVEYFDFDSESSNFDDKYELVDKEICKGIDLARVESRLSRQISILDKRLEITNEKVTDILKKTK